MIAVWGFWSSVVLIVYSYVGFPVLVLARTRWAAQPLREDPVERPWSVTVVIAAHNEADAIATKINSVLAQDYEGPIQCVIVSDGSSDETAAVARATGGRRVTVVEGPRTGKAGALNAGIDLAVGEIVVFTDANSLLAPDAVSQLVRPFADPSVGGVAGDQRYIGSDGGVSGERAYWSLDRRLKVAASTSGSVISATGALYAVRRSLVIDVPEGVTDDFAISTAVVEQGYRLVFAPDAVAWEPPASSMTGEYRRKVRVMTRGLRGVILRRGLLDPRRTGFYAVQLFSHKVLRRLSVLPLLTCVATAVYLRHRPGYRFVARTGVAALAAAALAVAGSRTSVRSNRCVAVLSYFGMVNVAAFHALWNVLSGNRIAQWTPERPSPKNST